MAGDTYQVFVYYKPHTISFVAGDTYQVFVYYKPHTIRFVAGDTYQVFVYYKPQTISFGAGDTYQRRDQINDLNIEWASLDSRLINIMKLIIN